MFVGFGALIAIRSGGTLEIDEIAYLRGVVAIGMLTVVAALVPVSLGRFDPAGHSIWALSSVVVLAGCFVLVVAMARTSEYRASVAVELERQPQCRVTCSGTLVAAVGIDVVVVGLAPLLMARRLRRMDLPGTLLLVE